MFNSTKRWWLVFGLLIALPALILAVLGLRALRTERIEREDQVRREQQRIATQIDELIADLIEQLETEDDEAFRFDRQGLLVFPSESVYFGEHGLRPRFLTSISDWPAPVVDVIEQARAAEAQGRPSVAVSLYESIGRSEPALSDWANFSKARVQAGSGVGFALTSYSGTAHNYVKGLTPSGLPVALLASAEAARLPGEGQRELVPVVVQLREDLHKGTWWLSDSERAFYDRALLGMIQNLDPSVELELDSTLLELTHINSAVRASPPSRRNEVTSTFVRTEHGGFLFVWTPDDADPDVWTGVALSENELRARLDAELATLMEGREYDLEIRDARGESISGEPLGDDHFWNTTGSREIRELEFAFTAPSMIGSQPVSLLWYGFVGLLVVVLMTGVAMTVRVVRKEMELSRLRDELIASVSHEFKSPITGVRLLIERLVGDRSLSEGQTALYYDTIERELNRLERLVDRLLSTQRVKTTPSRLHFEQIDPLEVIERVVSLLEPTASERGISIDVAVKGQSRPLKADRAALVDALGNLIDNAIKYSPPGGRITVSLLTESDSLRFDIVDEGIGIPSDDLERIFERFFRSQSSDTLDVRGTGLGLALVKAVAEAHDGKIEVHSSPGRGSTFSLHLPLREDDDEDSDSR